MHDAQSAQLSPSARLQLTGSASGNSPTIRVDGLARASFFYEELGLPTAHAAGPLAGKLVGDADPLVMPLAHGPMRGRAVTPLHALAPEAAAKDARLHHLLSLMDVFRIGRARDRQVAAAELRAWL